VGQKVRGSKDWGAGYEKGGNLESGIMGGIGHSVSAYTKWEKKARVHYECNVRKR